MTAVNLVKIPLWSDRLIAIAQRRGMPMRRIDSGYLVHSFLREVWQDMAPAPFHFEDGRSRTVDVWGYTDATVEQLVTHVGQVGDPEWLSIFAAPEQVFGRPVPAITAGTRIEFRTRICPVVRTRSDQNASGEREIDAWLAACIEKGLPVDGTREEVDRETVYREWLRARLERAGLDVQAVVGRRFHLESLLRRTHTPARDVRIVRRPDAEFEVAAEVRDAATFNDALRRGIGRHRAFGFGMIRLLRIGAC